MNQNIVSTSSASIANAVGVATVVAVAAPGANKALVLRGYCLYITRTTGAALVDGRIIATTSTLVLALAEGLQLTGVPGAELWIPGAGVLLGVNESITLRSDASAATGSLQAVIYYETVGLT